MKRKENMEAKP